MRRILSPVILILGLEARAELNFQQVILDNSYYAYERDVGDVDDDGDNDLVAVQEGDTAIHVFRAPDWTRSTLISITGTYRWPRADDFKVADIDGDGDVDVITRLGDGPTSESAGPAVWYENLGGGTGWTQRTIGTSLEYVKDIVVADFDRDDKPDVAMRMDSRTQLWLQDAGGSWSEVVINHPSHEGMDAGDLDMDGDPDLIMNGFWFPTPDTPAAARVAGNYVQHTIDSQWFGQGGDWTADSCKVVVGDFDGNGSNDVAFSHSERAGYAVTWYRSPTPLVDASWSGRTVVVVDYCHNLQAADWDIDGDDDLLVGGMESSSHRGLKLMLNDGTGMAWSEHVIQADGSYSAEMGDIDNDGDMDIVGILNWDSAPTWIYRSNAGGGPSLDFWFYKQVSASHARTFGLCFPDADGDGDRDIASGRYVYLNPGPPMTSAWAQATLPASVHAFATLDVDGDSFADLMALQDNAGASRIDIYWVESSNSAGTSRSAPILIGDVPRSDHAEGFQGYKVAQVVTGGLPEVIVSTMQGIYYFEVPASPGAGSWPRTMVAANDSDEGIGVADIDGDGFLDVSFTSGGSKDVKWARNPGDGSGSWAVHTIGSFSEADWPDRCEAADLDGDGRMDIVATEENSGVSPDALACWWQQPAASATQANWTRRTVATQYTMNNLDAADMDQDGDTDLVLAEHRGTEKIGVWENDGAGSFEERPVGTGRESHLGGRAVDLDNDGDLDLVSIAYDDYTQVHLWRNDSPSGTPRVAKPVISPSGGVFDEPVTVAITVSTSGAEIWFTMDGSDPTNAGPVSILFTNSFPVTNSTTVKARGFKESHDPSLVASAVFVGPKARTPVISPSGGTFTTSLVVTISCATTGATLRFTQDGAEPSEFSAVYTQALVLTTGMTVKARAYRAGLDPSDVASALFVRSAFTMLAHWRLDEQFGGLAMDSTGNGHTGTLNGAIWTGGYYGNGILLDGSDDHVAVPAFDIGGTSMAITAWALLDPSIADNDARILSKASGSAEQDHYWMLSLTSVSGDRRLRFRLKTAGSTTTLIASSGNVPLDTWVHVAAVFDGANMKVYLNGVEVGSAAKSGTISQSGIADVMIGANPPMAYAPFEGRLDDVRLFGQALTADEVVAIMNDPPPEVVPALSGADLAGSQVALSVPTEWGRYYILELNTNLLAGHWTPLETNAGSGATLIRTQHMGHAAGAFRVMKQ